MHAGEEGVAPGGAALLGVIGHEDPAFIANAIDVGGFPDHQAAMIDAGLHPADVIAHYKKDVRLLRTASSAPLGCSQIVSGKNAQDVRFSRLRVSGVALPSDKAGDHY
jgi:hypothetical protein